MAIQYLSRAGGQVAFEDHGGSGPVVVAAPGMGDTRGVYRHVVPSWVGAGLRVVTMDLRGLGASSSGWSDLSDAAIATDVLAAIEDVDDGPAVVVGNSKTCASAVIAAATAPDHVAGIVLIGPFVRDLDLPWWQRTAFAAMLAPPWGRAVWIAYYRRLLYPGSRPSDHDEYVRSLSANLAEAGRMRDFRRLAGDDHAESGRRLADVRQPALVVMGTADPDFPDPVAEARHVGAALGAEVLLVEGAGHYPQADHPEVVGPAVVSFVRRLGR